MAETTGLLNRRTGHSVPRVRISSSPHESGSRVSGSPFLCNIIVPLSHQMIEERPHRPLFCLPIFPVEYKSLTYRKLRIFVCSNLTGHFLATNYQSITSIQRTGRQVKLNGAFSWTSFKVILIGREGTFFALIDVNCLISIFYYETHTSMSSVFYESVRICTAYCGRQS